MKTENSAALYLSITGSSTFQSECRKLGRADTTPESLRSCKISFPQKFHIQFLGLGRRVEAYFHRDYLNISKIAHIFEESSAPTFLMRTFHQGEIEK